MPKHNEQFPLISLIGLDTVLDMNLFQSSKVEEKLSEFVKREAKEVIHVMHTHEKRIPSLDETQLIPVMNTPVPPAHEPQGELIFAEGAYQV